MPTAIHCRGHNYMVMKKAVVIISLGVFFLFAWLSCSQQHTPASTGEYLLSDDFVEVARINFQEIDDQYKPSSMVLKGVQKDQEKFAFLDYRRQECIVFDSK